MGSNAAELEFVETLRTFEPLIWYAANRYEIPGVLLPEDLYQEGLIALEDALVEHWDHPPDSEEFARAFKSRLFHRVHDVLKRHKTQSRDWRKEVRALLDEDDEDDGIVARLRQSTFPPPDRGLELRDLTRFLERLRDDLKQASLEGSLWGNSADDALEILEIVSDDEYEIPKHIRDLYERMPTHMTNAILGEITGWDRMKVRRALKRLRKHARTIARQFGYQIPEE